MADTASLTRTGTEFEIELLVRPIDQPPAIAYRLGELLVVAAEFVFQPISAAVHVVELGEVIGGAQAERVGFSRGFDVVVCTDGGAGRSVGPGAGGVDHRSGCIQLGGLGVSGAGEIAETDVAGPGICRVRGLCYGATGRQC